MRPETVGDLVLPDDRQENTHRVIIALVKARVVQLVDAALAHAATDGSLDLHRQVTFDEALNLAATALPPRKPSAPAYAVKAHEKPLLEHIAAMPLLDPRDRAMLAGFVRRLLGRINELERELEPKRGRPAREPNKATPAHERAEGYAVQLVRLKQAQWRQKYRLERVPAAETDRMIQEAKSGAARMCQAKVRRVSEDKIRSALKSGRFTVR